MTFRESSERGGGDGGTVDAKALRHERTLAGERYQEEALCCEDNVRCRLKPWYTKGLGRLVHQIPQGCKRQNILLGAWDRAWRSSSQAARERQRGVGGVTTGGAFGLGPWEFQPAFPGIEAFP